MCPHLKNDSLLCFTCDLYKITQTLFQETFPKAPSQGQYLHLDLCGPISPPSESGAKYFLHVGDDYSCFVWVFLLEEKSEAKLHINKLTLKIKNKPNTKKGNIISENGSDFKDQELTSLFDKEGISHLATLAYNQEHNPLAKRGN
ncbi:hypothetical protein O181_004026 [Austropuccinia psidii MF-1]|uniref:Integrase catalytic domain-containing protein n=1 Tax=Austropuccinia psidii MF-1 TaxID=1389203 RepID=A0A9Q3BER5_9BASI|nr:hypothetical protein [Austropuccinia psidii MF-1]